MENCEDEFLRFDLEYEQIVVLEKNKNKKNRKKQLHIFLQHIAYLQLYLMIRKCESIFQR